MAKKKAPLPESTNLNIAADFGNSNSKVAVYDMDRSEEPAYISMPNSLVKISESTYRDILAVTQGADTIFEMRSNDGGTSFWKYGALSATDGEAVRVTMDNRYTPERNTAFVAMSILEYTKQGNQIVHGVVRMVKGFPPGLSRFVDAMKEHLSGVEVAHPKGKFTFEMEKVLTMSEPGGTFMHMIDVDASAVSNGVAVVIDIGGGTIDRTVYQDGKATTNTKSIPFGVNNLRSEFPMRLMWMFDQNSKMRQMLARVPNDQYTPSVIEDALTVGSIKVYGQEVDITFLVSSWIAELLEKVKESLGGNVFGTLILTGGGAALIKQYNESAINSESILPDNPEWATVYGFLYAIGIMMESQEWL